MICEGHAADIQSDYIVHIMRRDVCTVRDEHILGSIILFITANRRESGLRYVALKQNKQTSQLFLDSYSCCDLKALLELCTLSYTTDACDLHNVVFFFILRRMGKNKVLAHHPSTYFHTRRVSI